MNDASHLALRRLLIALGWENEALHQPADWPRGPQARQMLPPAAAEAEPLYLMRAGTRELILLLLPHGRLPASGLMSGAYRDHSPVTAQLLDSLQPFAAPNECTLLIDDRRFFLYEVGSRELLLQGDTLADREERLYPLLTHKRDLRAALARLPRRPVTSQGLQLAGFLRLLRHELGAHGHLTQIEARRWEMQLLVAAYFTVREPRPDGPPPHRLFFETLAVETDSPTLAADLLSQMRESFNHLYRRHSLDLFDPLPTAAGEALASEPEPGWLSRQFQGFMMLAPGRYRSEVLESAFLGLDDERLTLKQALSRNEFGLGELAHEGATVLRPVRVDATRHGMGWALQVLRALLDLFEEERAEQERRLSRTGSLGETLDLFQPLSPGASRSGVVEDPVMLVLHDALRLHGDWTPERRLDAEVLIVCTILDWLWCEDKPERQRLRVSFASLRRVFASPIEAASVSAVSAS